MVRDNTAGHERKRYATIRTGTCTLNSVWPGTGITLTLLIFNGREDGRSIDHFNTNTAPQRAAQKKETHRRQRWSRWGGAILVTPFIVAREP